MYISIVLQRLRIKRILVLVLALVLIMGCIPVSASSKQVKVNTRTKLLKEMKKSSSSTIVFSSKTKKTIKIPKIDAAENKKLIIYAPNATIVNNSLFDEITIKAGKKYTENVSGNKITIKGKNVNFILSKGKSLNAVTIESSNANIDLQKKSSIIELISKKKSANICLNVKEKAVAFVSLIKKAQLNVSGSTKASVTLVSSAKGSKVSGNVKVLTDTALTNDPEVVPTVQPTTALTGQPVEITTTIPTNQPEVVPTTEPTSQAVVVPITAPTNQPVVVPTTAPTSQPIVVPNTAPTNQPVVVPTTVPTNQPVVVPTTVPTSQPVVVTTTIPTTQPIEVPTEQPSTSPTTQPVEVPTEQPSTTPTTQPVEAPTEQPSTTPTTQPVEVPTEQPSTSPTTQPVEVPTEQPTDAPTTQPTEVPTTAPTSTPDVNRPSTTSVTVEYKQRDARAMLQKINDFRYDEGADPYDLVYDYRLEKAAMQRAVELTASFSHNRPDGSDYKVTLAENNLDTSPRGILYGENILFGIKEDMDLNGAFEYFSTDVTNREIMLRSFEAVGIAYIIYDDYAYWVQVYADEVIDTGYTDPVEGTISVPINKP